MRGFGAINPDGRVWLGHWCRPTFALKAHCFRLAHVLTMGVLRDEGSLLSKLPFAAIIEMHTVKGMSSGSQPLSSSLLMYGRHIHVNASCLNMNPALYFLTRHSISGCAEPVHLNP